MDLGRKLLDMLQPTFDGRKLLVKTFADGEICVEYDSTIRGADLFIVQSITGKVNDSLMELILAIDAARRASAHRVTVVIPYFAYAR